MKKLPLIISAAVVIAGFASLVNLSSQSQSKLVVEPDPSFFEGAVSNHRHPDVDTDVFLYINHWRNSLPYEGHGGLIERDILTPGDPARPLKKGAVLKYLKGYKRAVLQARTNTQTYKDPGEQAFFYVMSGTGTVEAGAKKAAIEEGSAVVVPAGFSPNKEASVGSYHDALPSVGMHWAHVGRGFVYDVPPKFANPMGLAAVSIDNFDIAQPHVHGPGCEEIWCQVKGRSLLLFGNRLLSQEPGEAFLVPPNNKVPHSSINPSGEPMLWLYLGNRHDRDQK